MDILKNGKFGVMALAGDDGYPYGVPLHYVLIDGIPHFHGTAEGGYRRDCIANNPKASFTVIESKNGIKARSAIVFGKVEMIPDMRITVLEKMIEKVAPRFAWKKAKADIPAFENVVIAYRLKPERITAKAVDKPEKEVYRKFLRKLNQKNDL